ncbi:hypothetical protein BLL52_4304 [Rhodoferax antarcticus ANT.BR]|uniref:Uncharacterized protein n=1 Tax=Rhodoferax antarcticus ANT.BR TaxID=1111071 RepID=A0A1Q8Y940_9BURK|nr:hypothetical protein BLL52_4304 [Rhodoferax antarcticus ANT.BR]
MPHYVSLATASWGQETLKPIYLYAHDVDAMAIELMAAGQRTL